MDEAHDLVAAVAEVDWHKFLAALIKREELEIGGSMVEPRHALGRCVLRPSGHDDFESAEVAAGIAFLPAVVEPENAEGQDAVDGGGGFCFTDADDGFGGGATEEAAANVGGAEAVLEIHGRAKAVDLGAEKSAGQDAFEQSLIVAARGVAGGGSAAIAVRDKFESLRLRSAHATGHDAQALSAWLNFDDGADEVAFFAPKLEQAAAVGFGDGVAREAHVEEDAAVFEQSSGGVGGEIFFEDFGEFGSGWCVDCRGHERPTSSAARARFVMCAV